MKKKVLFLTIALVIIISTVLVGCSSTPPPSAITSAPPTTAPANAIKLKYSDQNPTNGYEYIHSAQPWLEQMTKATNGQVQFETYYSETLYKGTDAWTSTKNGIGDVAWMFHGYWANMTPLADVISLPLMPFTSAKQASGIFWQLYQKYPTMADAFKDNHVLLTFTSEPYFLITTKKQVKTMDDIKGLKIRVPGGPPTELMKMLGAVPVAEGMPSTYLDLKNGVLDGMAVPWEAMMDYRQYEVVKYYTYIPLFTVYFTQAMNNAKWNSLSPAIQNQINSVCGLQGSLFWGENMFDSAVAVGHDQVKKQGTEMIEYTIPQDELAKWSTVAGQPLWDAWVKTMTDAGHPEAKDILNTTLSLVKSYKP